MESVQLYPISLTAVIALCLTVLSSPVVFGDEPRAEPVNVAARGRIEPRGGLYAVAGPSGPMAVVTTLMVDVGEHVKKGQLIALLDDASLKQANVERAKAQRATVVNERKRKAELRKKNMISVAEMEALDLQLTIADAELAQARAELNRSHVKSPIDGRVIAVHARDGERVGIHGIVELGRTAEMYVIAEIYETDIGRVQVGQRVTASSPALALPLVGSVERIGLKVGKMEALATDPTSRADARIVEVEVRLEDSAKAADFTNLQVEVVVEA